MTCKTGEDYIASPEKRALDITGASLLTLVSAPVVGAAAAALCFERGRLDPIFRQERVGRHGQLFMINKLQTIPQQSDENNFDTFGAADPRATKLGRFIRKTGIDELPQVVNILAGDLSMVGIRPQVDWVLERRRQLDPALFEDWYYCYERNLGVFGDGQAYAHQAGGYKEDSEIIRDLMKIDIVAYQMASLSRDIETILGQPWPLIRAAMRQAV